MNLRQKAMQGGAYMLARQASGFLGNLVLLIFVVRVIGPRQYGIYAASAGIVGFLSGFASLGSDYYLQRNGVPTTDDDLHSAFTLLSYVSVFLCSVVFWTAGPISHAIKIRETVPVIRALALTIPLYVMAFPATMKLSRELNFKRVAINDLLGQSVQCLVAVPLALYGAGVWAPVAGLLALYGTILVSAYIGARFMPRLKWDRQFAKEMLSYGFSYSTSSWARQARSLANPVIVGHFGGAEAVGYVAAATRIAQGLAFGAAAVARVATPTLSRMRSDTERFKRGVVEVMKYQAIVVGVPLALFMLVAPLAIRLAMGPRWAAVVVVFPFVALGYFALSVFQIEATAVHIFGANYRVTIFYGVQFLLLAGVAAMLVRPLGIIGYGFAEIVALLSYFVIHLFYCQIISKQEAQCEQDLSLQSSR
jgi:PST family polysaccharide transporter